MFYLRLSFMEHQNSGYDSHVTVLYEYIAATDGCKQGNIQGV